MSRQPGHNRLVRLLQPVPPRHYLDNSARFGTVQPVTFHIPDGGTLGGLRLALLQHELVRDWRRLAMTQAALASDWPFSEQTVSDTVLGKRWAYDPAGGAMLHAIRRCRPTGPTHPTPRRPRR